MTLEREHTALVDTEPQASDEPRLRDCPTCRLPVLLHPSLRALGVLLECTEVIPAGTCPTCHGAPAVIARGDEEAPCWEPDDAPHGYAVRTCPTCHGARVLGETIHPGEQLVALSAWGRARPTTVADWRHGEALHREHHCAT